MNWLQAVRAVGFVAALVLMAWAIPVRVFASGRPTRLSTR
jgi:hypothetical protein